MKKSLLCCFALILCLTLIPVTPTLAVELCIPPHVLLSWKNVGSCQSLTGEVPLTVVFVDLPDAPWTEEAKQACKTSIEEAASRLVSEAAAYGASLSFTAKYYTSCAEESTSVNDNSEAWAANVLDFSDELEPLRYDNVLPTFYIDSPVLFWLNTAGRAFAHAESGDTSAEYLMLYENSTAAVIRHELLHLYGAYDYYLLQDFRRAANEYCPDSLMLSGWDDAGTVDSLTAFAIGWCTLPDETARNLLQATEHITEDDVAAAKKADRITGYGVKQGTDNVYYGLMDTGIWNGHGTLVRDNGDVYTGDFINGERTGQGTIVWTNGNSYTGDFVDGKRTGQGTYTWANGDVYTGDFINGERTGQGTLIRSNGNVYTGDFINGERTGHGTIAWASGDSYTGDLVNGVGSGQGSYAWADGDSYTGDFTDGERTGYGTYLWANGDKYIGSFFEGQRNGYGMFISAEGEITLGLWEKGEYVGSGVAP